MERNRSQRVNILGTGMVTGVAERFKGDVLAKITSSKVFTVKLLAEGKKVRWAT